MKMSSFDRFKKINSTYKQATEEKVNNHFLFKGYPSIEIIGTNGDKVQAAVYNKQEKDEGYIYTQLSSPLDIGSVWAAKSLHFLVDEEIITIKDVGWHKYHCILCNVELDGCWGFFLGPEKKHINLSLKQDVLLMSQQKPLLVLAGSPLQIEDKVLINNRGWIVDEYDNISTQGITYYSLLPTTISKDIIEQAEDGMAIEKYEAVIYDVQEPEVVEDYVLINAGMQITATTQNNYFKSTCRLKIINRSSDKVVFEVPFGIDSFTIYYRKDDAVVSQNYRVVA